MFGSEGALLACLDQLPREGCISQDGGNFGENRQSGKTIKKSRVIACVSAFGSQVPIDYHAQTTSARDRVVEWVHTSKPMDSIQTKFPNLPLSSSLPIFRVCHLRLTYKNRCCTTRTTVICVQGPDRDWNRCGRLLL